MGARTRSRWRGRAFAAWVAVVAVVGIAYPGHAVVVFTDAWLHQGLTASFHNGANTASVDSAFTGPGADAFFDSDYPTPYPPFVGTWSRVCVSLKIATKVGHYCGPGIVAVDPALQSGKVTASFKVWTATITVNVTVVVPQGAPPSPIANPSDLLDNCDPPTRGCPGTHVGVERAGTVTGGSISSSTIGGVTGSGTGKVYMTVGVYGEEYD